MDISLRTSYPKNALEKRQKQIIESIDQFCTNYEKRIRELGGIGFFLGGIGPDGHIAFNVQGSDHFSTTRLTPTNYETQAAAASDLGGIENSRNRLVITIGLQTITYNPDTTAIIIAAGEAKARMIRQAIQSEMNNYFPASVLQKLPNASFYITKGAAKLLDERFLNSISNQETLKPQIIQQVITDLALAKNKKLTELTRDDFDQSPAGKVILNHLSENIDNVLKAEEQDYIQRINCTLDIPNLDKPELKKLDRITG
ncbi:6-phosphogluconolactonase [candidate division KSB1 bacterium]|nr:6-phosphogluconolactonase [candidate division KSB1 bacterium]